MGRFSIVRPSLLLPLLFNSSIQSTSPNAPYISPLKTLAFQIAPPLLTPFFSSSSHTSPDLFFSTSRPFSSSSGIIASHFLIIAFHSHCFASKGLNWNLGYLYLILFSSTVWMIFTATWFWVYTHTLNGDTCTCKIVKLWGYDHQIVMIFGLPVINDKRCRNPLCPNDWHASRGGTHGIARWKKSW